MKLASYADGSRDGHLIVVAADLASCHYASQSVSRLQGLLDDWNFLSPQLEDLAATVNGGKARHAMPFDPGACRAPVARAPRCVRLVGADPDSPDAVREEAAWFSGPRLGAAPSAPNGRWAPHLAVITADVPVGADDERASESVRLYGFAVRPAETPAGEPEPATGAWHFAPVVVTPGDARLQSPGWTWEAAGAARGEARRAAREAPAAGDGPLIPAHPVIARAIARAAARAPLPAGSVLLLPLAEPSAGARSTLALVDASGDPVFGRVQVGSQPADG